MSIFQKHLNYELLSDPSSFIIHFNMPFEMSVRGGLLLSKFKNDLILSSRGMVSIFQNEIQKYLNYSRGLGLDRNFSQFLTQAYCSPAVGTAFGQSTAGNDIVAIILISLFLFFYPRFYFTVFFLPPLLPFPIEEVLGSKGPPSGFFRF